jgi:hypothetical protein
MTWESLKQTLPENAIWPQNNIWGIHDYCLESAQGAASFNQMIENGFGAPSDAKQFTELAQWINYNGYRGMFEGRSMYRQGLLLWMSHSCWPSMVWQTYDYYFDPTTAYFGCKKASEPIHIQWNPVFDTIEVVNYNGSGKEWILKTTLNNNTDQPVLMVRLKVVGEKSGERILPVLFSDNSISIMPGEEKVISMELKDADTGGEKPAVEISGFNL